jgi:hypothetical protein
VLRDLSPSLLERWNLTVRLYFFFEISNQSIQFAADLVFFLRVCFISKFFFRNLPAALFRRSTFAVLMIPLMFSRN